MANLAEKGHLEVLIGLPITNMRSTLLNDRGHVKHTEVCNFRQAGLFGRN